MGLVGPPLRTCRPAIGMSRSVVAPCVFSVCLIRGPQHPASRSWPFESGRERGGLHGATIRLCFCKVRLQGGELIDSSPVVAAGPQGGLTLALPVLEHGHLAEFRGIVRAWGEDLVVFLPDLFGGELLDTSARPVRAMKHCAALNTSTGSAASWINLPQALGDQDSGDDLRPGRLLQTPVWMIGLPGTSYGLLQKRLGKPDLRRVGREAGRKP